MQTSLPKTPAALVFVKCAARINTSKKVWKFAFSRSDLCCYSFTESLESLFQFIHLLVLTLLKQKGGD